jgi:hypothetical protein
VDEDREHTLEPSEIYNRYTEEVDNPLDKTDHPAVPLEDKAVQPLGGRGDESGSRVHTRRFGDCVTESVIFSCEVSIQACYN